MCNFCDKQGKSFNNPESKCLNKAKNKDRQQTSNKELKSPGQPSIDLDSCNGHTLDWGEGNRTKNVNNETVALKTVNILYHMIILVLT